MWTRGPHQRGRAGEGAGGARSNLGVVEIFLTKAPGRGFPIEVVTQTESGYDGRSDANYFRCWDEPQPVPDEDASFVVAQIDGETGLTPLPGWTWALLGEAA